MKMAVFINHDGGAKLTIALKDMKRRYATAYAHVGLFRAAEAKKGAINEFGDPGHNLPPRPFMQTTFYFHYRKWLQIMLTELRKSDGASKNAVMAAGKVAATDVTKTLINAPAFFKGNAESTIAKKGFDYPLLETGKMFRAISYRFRKGPL